MSDYIPLPPDPARDPRNRERNDLSGSRRGLALLVGILVAIALVGGVMYFAGHRGSSRVEQAQAPIDRSLPAPADRHAPAQPPAAAAPR